MEVDVAGVRVVILPVIRGLVSERARVRAAIAEVRPAAIGLSISREDLAALRSGPEGDPGPSGSEEEAYLARLAAFADVDTPLGCFAEGVAAAGRSGIPVHPLDMDDAAFASAYMDAVSAWEFLRSGARAAKMQRWRARTDTPEAFVAAWDARVNRTRGLRALQRQRESHIALRIRELARDPGPVLAVVERERANGVVDRMRA